MQDRLIRQGKFGYPTLGKKLYRLDGQIVGLIGFGKISRNLSRMLIDAFGMRILTYDPYLINCGRGAIVKEDDLVKVLKELLEQELTCLKLSLLLLMTHY